MARIKKGPTTEITPVDISEIIGTLTDSYGPFPDEPRLDPAHELTFTILSQHTSDTNSERAFQGLMNRFGDLMSVAQADISDIEQSISRGGLAKIKAPRIKTILNRILELNGSLDLSFLSEMPLQDAKTWLRQLPGIGPKSAGIILNFSLGMPAMAIDTHIYRVCQRLGLIGKKVTADKAHELMEEAVNPDQVFTFHIAFITHGRQVCKAQRPLCEECILATHCPSKEQFNSLTSSGGSDTLVAKSKGKPITTKPNKKSKRVSVKQLPHSIPSEEET